MIGVSSHCSVSRRDQRCYVIGNKPDHQGNPLQGLSQKAQGRDGLERTPYIYGDKQLPEPWHSRIIMVDLIQDLAKNMTYK